MYSTEIQYSRQVRRQITRCCIKAEKQYPRMKAAEYAHIVNRTIFVATQPYRMKERRRLPHQGARELARRVRQIAKGQIHVG